MFDFVVDDVNVRLLSRCICSIYKLELHF